MYTFLGLLSVNKYYFDIQMKSITHSLKYGFTFGRMNAKIIREINNWSQTAGGSISCNGFATGHIDETDRGQTVVLN